MIFEHNNIALAQNQIFLAFDINEKLTFSSNPIWFQVHIYVIRKVSQYRLVWV